MNTGFLISILADMIIIALKKRIINGLGKFVTELKKIGIRCADMTKFSYNT